MDKYSINEIMEMAVQTEIVGYQFYTSMAEKFKGSGDLNRLFTTLAAKEKTHQKIFSDLKEQAAKRGPEPLQWEDVSDYLRAIVESEFFLGRGKSLPSMDHIESVQEAVNFALGFEKETLLYFMELRTAVKEKEVVDKVIEEEKSHVIWLERFKEGLKK